MIIDLKAIETILERYYQGQLQKEDAWRGFRE
jgi:hypothetical protein